MCIRDSPTLVRATEQWFVVVDELRQRALRAVEEVAWIPARSRERMRSMLEVRPDWCISRQRAWGVPLPFVHCQGCGEALVSPELIEHVARLVEREGPDIWWSRPLGELLPPGLSCPRCGSRELRGERDILDVWFDSGVSHAAVLERDPDLRWPADLYLEGSDQHRGWFHSSLLTAVATRGRPPYRAVLTHGFVVDGQGRKMSKSLGNVIHPQEVVERYGAEVLRLWVASQDYAEDLRLSPEILGQVVEAYRRIRNTCRFLLGNLYDFHPQRDAVEPCVEIDRFMLCRLQRLVQRVRRAYERYQFHLACRALQEFCAVELSALYLDVLKDRLYVYPPASRERRSAQSTLYLLLRGLCLLMAPVLCFTAEEVWGHIPGAEGSVHLQLLPEVDQRWVDEALERVWQQLLEVRREVNRALEGARRRGEIRGSLEAGLVLRAPGPLLELLEARREDLRALFIVSALELREGDRLSVEVHRAPGRKCARCWNYAEDVGSDARWPEVCGRCAGFLEEMGWKEAGGDG